MEYNNKKIKAIVLKTTGKNDEVDSVSVFLFDDIEDAEKFCEENTDKDPEKYWQYCDIIEEGKEYFPARYKNY
jgi:hypothetical protein